MANLKLLLVGIGNPGQKYVHNRHNIGFVILDSLLDSSSGSYQTNSKYSLARTDEDGVTIFYLKPLEFMNLSGKAVAEIAKKNGILPENILVIHDEIDFEFGKLKLKGGGGHAGHNGLRNIVEKLGTNTFFRLRFGVGKPSITSEVPDYVLSNFLPNEKEKIPELVKTSLQKISDWIRERKNGFQKLSDNQ
ncbi:MULTISPECIES: aminoacyl-tRNA hydrolase [Leptospira]|uniref:Peptidyl-tRNA hydrolase n=3 Tax=Leptospira kirschneri TaxID=29507 RepID=A0A1T1DNN3_9LEPT|nr:MULTISPECIES: aminoacyl-tRNA hydrolase [Leptospira]EKO14942.1 aminoacyl-tRNA hydrolase [Leptospira kirschneri str. H1]EKO58711.1 aminoacyl-tRNA hydrolase [Leptospira kirschneri str. H2]EMJ92728.1 aminoacyl-tRNA hydrolase [Leptospira kirschneri str. JB]EMK02969.1 aminoacyl-tRNA hydrolase [Leptospira kirschneri]EMK20082.1 aminoacyl-tRNA hydrolase [Leptospira kirschneri serovar Bulgarica str. Nikolaevo]